MSYPFSSIKSQASPKRLFLVTALPLWTFQRRIVTLLSACLKALLSIPSIPKPIVSQSLAHREPLFFPKDHFAHCQATSIIKVKEMIYCRWLPTRARKWALRKFSWTKLRKREKWRWWWRWSARSSTIRWRPTRQDQISTSRKHTFHSQWLSVRHSDSKPKTGLREGDLLISRPWKQNLLWERPFFCPEKVGGLGKRVLHQRKLLVNLSQTIGLTSTLLLRQNRMVKPLLQRKESSSRSRSTALSRHDPWTRPS